MNARDGASNKRKIDYVVRRYYGRNLLFDCSKFQIAIYVVDWWEYNLVEWSYIYWFSVFVPRKWTASLLSKVKNYMAGAKQWHHRLNAHIQAPGSYL